jgi:hypothetical protein
VRQMAEGKSLSVWELETFNAGSDGLDIRRN